MRDENVPMAETMQILDVVPLPQIPVVEIPPITILVTTMLAVILKRKGRLHVFHVETRLEDNGALGTALPDVSSRSKIANGKTNKE